MGSVLVVGSTCVDLTFYVEAIPVVGQTVAGKFVQGLGGKGFNQAVASQLSGSTTKFITATGPMDQDPFAPLFARKLEELKIESALESVVDHVTGAAAISVDAQARNNVIVALGANDRLSPRFLDQQQGFLKDVDVLLLQFETNMEVIENALVQVKKANPYALTILNPAPAVKDIPASVLNLVDVLTPNETELEVISGQKTTTLEEVAAACKKIRGPKAILATLGEKGSFLCLKEGETKHYPAFSVQAIDTTGAGDAFNGGLASGWRRSKGNWDQAIEFASAVAALSVTRRGTSASMPAESEVLEFLQKQRVGT